MARILVLSGDDMSFYKFRKELISRLKELGHQTLLATRFVKYEKLLSDLGCETINIQRLERRGANPLTDLFLISDYKMIIKDFRPDVILTYTLKPRVYGNIASGKIPIINTITGMGSYTLDNPIVAKIATVLDKVGLKNTNHVFFQNCESRDIYYEKKLLNNRIPTTVVPASGVNLDDFSFMEYPTKGSIDFAFIGRVMKDKGVEELFYAAEQINKRYKNVHIHMFGFYEEDYEDTINDLNNRGLIEYHGFVEDVRPYLQKMSCVVLPSYHEGVGNAIQEAAATGRPVIASNIPGCRTVVDDGVTGYFCQPKDKESLLTAMTKFIELSVEERSRMGKLGREKMCKEHDRKIVIQKYIDAINSLL